MLSIGTERIPADFNKGALKFESSEHLVIHSLGAEAGKGDKSGIQLCQLCTGAGLQYVAGIGRS